MKRFLALFIMCTFFVTAIFAAETENEVQPPENQEDNTEYVYSANQSGDSFIRLSLAVDIPLKPENMFTGGSGTLGFYSFLSSWFAVGGDFSFAYSETLGSNVYYFIPLMARAMAQLTVGKFEFPILLGIGGSFQNYVDRMYFGLTIQPEIGAFYRIRQDWSAGVMCGLYIMPQWFDNEEYNYTGYIMTTTLSVRYHF